MQPEAREFVSYKKLCISWRPCFFMNTLQFCIGIIRSAINLVARLLLFILFALK